MTETKEQDAKKLGLSRPGKLELKKTVETGQVRQSFSHGRSKMVTVEVKKKRTYERDAGGRMTKVDERAFVEDPAEEVVDEVEEPLTTRAEIERADHLTDEERAARLRALEDARKGGDRAETRHAAGVELFPDAVLCRTTRQERRSYLCRQRPGDRSRRRGNGDHRAFCRRKLSHADRRGAASCHAVVLDPGQRRA